MDASLGSSCLLQPRNFLNLHLHSVQALADLAASSASSLLPLLRLHHQFPCLSSSTTSPRHSTIARPTRRPRLRSQLHQSTPLLPHASYHLTATLLSLAFLVQTSTHLALTSLSRTQHSTPPSSKTATKTTTHHFKHWTKRTTMTTCTSTTITPYQKPHPRLNIKHHLILRSGYGFHRSHHLTLAFPDHCLRFPPPLNP